MEEGTTVGDVVTVGVGATVEVAGAVAVGVAVGSAETVGVGDAAAGKATAIVTKHTPTAIIVKTTANFLIKSPVNLNHTTSS